MELSANSPATNESWADQFAHTLAQQRRRVEEFLAAQRVRLEKAQAEVTQQAREFDQQAEDLRRERAEVARSREDLDRRQAELDAALAKLHYDQRSLALKCEEHRAEAEHTAQLRQRLEAGLAEAAAERRHLNDERIRTEAQRQRIAEEFRAQRAAHLKELDRRRAEQQAERESLHRERQALLEQAAANATPSPDAQTEARLLSLREDFQRRQAEFDAALAQRREELDRRQAELDAALAKLHFDQRALALEREEHRAEAEHTAQLRQRLEAGLAEAAAERHRLSDERIRTEAQRRRIAEEFRAQRAAHLKELDRRHAEQQAEFEALCRERQALADQAAAGATAPPDAQAAAKLVVLQAERDALARKLADAGARLADLGVKLSQTEEQLSRVRLAPADGEALSELRGRYEMALQDVRELKARNQELEQQLARQRQPGPASGNAADGLDWEAQKRRILAALEADFDANDPRQAAERLKIEEVLSQTDRIVAEKDCEIDELRKLLAHQSDNLGAVAVGAAALGEMLDKDAVIQEERANLRRLQDEWAEKLRQAEIEISMERAKIARQRSEIEEKLRTLSQLSASPTPAKPARGRWLSRLGLGGQEEG